MSKYRFTVHRVKTFTVDIEADTETSACERMEAYIQNGYQEDPNTEYCDTLDWDGGEPILLCKFCNEVPSGGLSVACCKERERLENKGKWKI